MQHSSPENAKGRDALLRPFRRRHALFLILLAIAGCDFLARDTLLTAVVKKGLKQDPEVDVELAAERLRLLTHHMRFEKILIARPPPNNAALLKVDAARVTWRWLDLLRGRVIASLESSDVKFTILRIPTLPAAAGTDTKVVPEPPSPETILDKWPDIRRRLMPFDVETLTLRDVELRFRDLTTQPPISLILATVDVEGKHLTNRQDIAPGERSQVAIRGAAPGGGKVELDISTDLTATTPDVRLAGSIAKVALPAFNPMTEAYGGIDLLSGSFSTDMQLATAKGHYKGKVAPTLREIHLSPDAEARQKDAWHKRALRSVARGVTNLVFSPNHPEVSTQVEVEGDIVTEKQSTAKVVLQLTIIALKATFRSLFSADA